MRTSINNIFLQVKTGRTALLGLLLVFCITASSQTITIGGNVYGGGRQGAVGTGKVNTTDPATADPSLISFKDNALANTTTSINIYSGNIKTVFGGGEQGRTFGKTSVNIQGANSAIQIGNNSGGGIFGAGDGSGAIVFGHSHVTIQGGTINQNIYGGGNEAKLIGTTNVTLHGGLINKAVYGGARVADINGYSFVDLDAKSNLLINAVYGGNDIAGNISNPGGWTWINSLELPFFPSTNTIDRTWNSFVYSHLSTGNAGSLFVGQLFGGGNGDYSYTDNNTVTVDGKEYTDVVEPVVIKSYIELKKGIFGYVYGGGNDATVGDNTTLDGNAVICLDNSTTTGSYALPVATLEAMDINTTVDADAFEFTTVNNVKQATLTRQFIRVFGGNNKAEMRIQPSWNIINANISSLYSGGNEGKMSNPNGILLNLDRPGLTANNVYGGCRRADVTPLGANNAPATPASTGTPGQAGYFPEGYAAKVLVTAGNITNVYGGNDISGNVAGGNAVDIRSHIKGDVYGGGNGSYVYTDNSNLASDRFWGDFYYNPGSNSAQALNAFRPNAEKAWIHVSGTESTPTIIEGSVYCGGNSATISGATGTAELNIGSYAIIQDVYLGSNGENMVKADILAKYNHGTETINGTSYPISSLSWESASETGSQDFETYIDGVSVNVRPVISFETSYVAKSTKIGSLYFGGNLGSVKTAGKLPVTIEEPVVIFDKLVAGCNDANYTNTNTVTENNINHTYNIRHEGGLTGALASHEETDPQNSESTITVIDDYTKVEMNLRGITLYPGKIHKENGDIALNSNNDYIDWNTTGTDSDLRLIGG